MTTPRMMAAMMTNRTPENRRVRESFFLRLMFTAQRSYLEFM
jgi:hypothetical protein